MDTEVDVVKKVGKVMIVDDEPFNISGIKTLLECITASMPDFDFKDRIEHASNGH